MIQNEQCQNFGRLTITMGYAIWFGRHHYSSLHDCLLISQYNFCSKGFLHCSNMITEELLSTAHPILRWHTMDSSRVWVWDGCPGYAVCGNPCAGVGDRGDGQLETSGGWLEGGRELARGSWESQRSQLSTALAPYFTNKSKQLLAIFVETARRKAWGLVRNKSKVSASIWFLAVECRRLIKTSKWEQSELGMFPSQSLMLPEHGKWWWWRWQVPVARILSFRSVKRLLDWCKYLQQTHPCGKQIN